MNAHQIKTLRNHLGLSQEQVEHITGVRVARLETGDRKPTKTHIKALLLLQEVYQLRTALAQAHQRIAAMSHAGDVLGTSTQTPSEV